MAVVGIVAEYNPFHAGHAWQIAELRRRLGADTPVVVAMSGQFVQRGDAALFRKHARAECAVRGGADLVFALPTGASLSSAEGFAAAGVELLAATGLVDTLVYGAECGSNAPLRRIAEVQASPDYAPALKAALKTGVSFASARETALFSLIGEEARYTEQPNHILGIAYETAVRRTALTTLALPRFGSSHDGYASASYVRDLLLRGEDASPFLPAATLEIYERERRADRAPASLLNAERAVLARLRALKEDDLIPFDEGNEGLYRRFYTAAHTAKSIEELLTLAKTKRYAHARLRRMLLRVWLGLTGGAEINYLPILAASERGCALLKEMKGRTQVPLLTKPADARRFEGKALDAFLDECRASDLYALLFPRPGESDREWRESPVML